jgi:hypothetical protein
VSNIARGRIMTLLNSGGRFEAGHSEEGEPDP